MTSSAAIATDTVPRSISLGEKDSGLLKLGSDKYIVTHTNQALYLVSDDSLDFAEEGTEISEQDGETYLGSGKMVVGSFEHDRRIRTPQGEVRIKKNSTVVLQVKQSGGLKILSLTGSGEFSSSSPEATNVEFSEGQEILANRNGIDDEELISAEGLPSGDVVNASVTKTSRTLITRTVSLKQYISKDIMINGSLVHIGGAKAKHHQQYVERVRASADNQGNLKPIGYAEIISGQLLPTPQAKPFATSEPFVISDSKSSIVKGASGLLVSSGKTLIFAKNGDVRVSGSQCEFILKKGDVAHVIESGNSTTVRSCSGVGALRVYVKDRMVKLAGGQELMITQGKANEAAIFQTDGVSHRRCVSNRHNNQSVLCSDFSMISMLVRSAFSKITPAEQMPVWMEVQRKILKTAACVQLVQGNKSGPYRTHP